MNDLVNESGDLVNDLVNDSISRQKALNSPVKMVSDGLEWVPVYHLRELPSAQRWIPVTERLPENDNDVLVTDGTDCAVAYWRTDAQAWDDCMHGWCDLYGLEVAAWMPLPTPYREGGQDNGSN